MKSRWSLKKSQVRISYYNQSLKDVEVTLLCRKKKVTRSEFYQANQAGLKPSLVVEIRNFEYENQEFANFEGKQYRILKTYPIDSEIFGVDFVRGIEMSLTSDLANEIAKAMARVLCWGRR